VTASPAFLLQSVNDELDALADSRVSTHVRSLLVEPTIVVRGWDYGRVDEAYPCWSVLEHAPSNTGIAYCEQGFGPTHPWGLVFLSGVERMSIGTDAGWYGTFLEAFFESRAAADLPIWRVYQGGTAGLPSTPLSTEGDWDTTWAQVMRLRELNPDMRYDCWHSLRR